MEDSSVYHRCCDSHSFDVLHQQSRKTFCDAGAASDDDVGGGCPDSCRADELYRIIFQWRMLRLVKVH